MIVHHFIMKKSFIGLSALKTVALICPNNTSHWFTATAHVLRVLFIKVNNIKDEGLVHILYWRGSLQLNILRKEETAAQIMA